MTKGANVCFGSFRSLATENEITNIKAIRMTVNTGKSANLASSLIVVNELNMSAGSET